MLRFSQRPIILRILFVGIGFSTLIGGGAGCDPSMQFFPGGGKAGNSFATAKLLVLNSSGNTPFSGNIVGGNIEIFDLGAVSPGDRVIVSVDASQGSTLDSTIAIFDENEQLFSLNDDVNLAAGLLGSAINDVVKVASAHFFLAVTKFFFATQGGTYVGKVRIERGGPIPSPPIQVLLLNYAGGSFTINNEGAFNINAFDAADVDAVYAGMTTLIKQRITAVVRENFANTGMTIVTSDENPTLTPGTFSTIHFGAFSATKFGVSDGVDQGNLDVCDDGIVFTNAFDKPFATQPTSEGIAVAIGNVAAHEAGHLLGLNHVSDIIALMDNTGTASTLLADQLFKTAPMSPSVFPLGTQNAPALLDRVVPSP